MLSNPSLCVHCRKRSSKQKHWDLEQRKCYHRSKQGDQVLYSKDPNSLMVFREEFLNVTFWLRDSGCMTFFWLVDGTFSSVQSCPTLCDAMNHSTPGLPVHHQLPKFTQTHVHLVSDDIQPSHPLSSPSPPAPNSSQHQSLSQWVNSSHEVAKVLEFQL